MSTTKQKKNVNVIAIPLIIIALIVAAYVNFDDSKNAKLAKLRNTPTLNEVEKNELCDLELQVEGSYTNCDIQMLSQSLEDMEVSKLIIIMDALAGKNHFKHTMFNIVLGVYKNNGLQFNLDETASGENGKLSDYDRKKKELIEKQVNDKTLFTLSNYNTVRFNIESQYYIQNQKLFSSYNDAVEDLNTQSLKYDVDIKYLDKWLDMGNRIQVEMENEDLYQLYQLVNKYNRIHVHRYRNEEEIYEIKLDIKDYLSN